jgi:hypothetical protein
VNGYQQLLAAACEDSSTSSKPPSSDIVKPKKPLPKGGKKRNMGGQPGHKQHVRSPSQQTTISRSVCARRRSDLVDMTSVDC